MVSLSGIISVRPEWSVPVADAQVLLTALIIRTKRIKIGPIVTPLPRTLPWKVARETVSLDHLSQGRLVLGVGIGNDRGREYSAFGQSPDDKLHGEMLDESLEVLTKLWSGEAFDFQGDHYTLNNACFAPTPLQKPRIPIWVAGVWPNKKPFRRAARWDGVCPIMRDRDLTPDDFREMLTYIQQYRELDSSFAVLASGRTQGNEEDKAIVTPFAEAGVNWWQEGFDWNNSLDQVRARIHKGPPLS